jgi:hypothetical protein
MLRGGVCDDCGPMQPGEVAELVTQYGVNFTLDAGSEKQIRDASKRSEAVIVAIRNKR